MKEKKNDEKNDGKKKRIAIIILVIILLLILLLLRSCSKSGNKSNSGNDSAQTSEATGINATENVDQQDESTKQEESTESDSKEQEETTESDSKEQEETTESDSKGKKESSKSDSKGKKESPTQTDNEAHSKKDAKTHKSTDSKATPIVTAPTAKTLIYNGSAQALVDAGSTTGGTLQYKLGNSGTYSTVIPTATNAGTYFVYYKVVGDDNYIDVIETSISVTISKAKVDVPTAKSSLIYNGTEQTGVELSDDAEYKLTDSTATNAGDYTATAILTNKNNYEWNIASPTSENQSITWSIKKANGNVTAPTAKTGLTYTGSAQKLVNAGSSTTGKIQYSLTSGSGYSTSIPTATDAGTYTVYYKVIGDDNYSDVKEASVSVTISKAKVDVPTAKSSLIYDGTEQTGVELPGDAEYTLTNNSATNAGDYTATSTLTDKNNYEWNIASPTSENQSITWSIGKADGSVNAPTAITALLATGSAQELVNAGSSTTGEIQYKLGEDGTYSTSIPTATFAGTYIVYYKVVGDSNHNDVDEASVEVTIGGCFIAGTKISMADGSTKNIEDIEEGDLVKTFDHEKGEVSSEKVCYVYESEDTGSAFTLHFTNDISLSIVGAHALLEKESRKYIVLTQYNAKNYIGKYFYNADTEDWEVLEYITHDNKKYKYYSIYSANHLNCVAEHMISVVDDTACLLNVFELDENLKIDPVKKQRDIERYGLLTFEECDNVTQAMFENFNYEYVNVAFGKGLITYDEAVKIRDQAYEYEMAK